MPDERIVHHFTLAHAHGLHLRPATLLARTSARFAASVSISNHHGMANAKSALGIVSLGVAAGDRFSMVAEGPDAGEAMRAIVALLVTTLACCVPAAGRSHALPEHQPALNACGAVA